MIEKLLEYQKVDGELRDIEVSISQSEEKKKAAAAYAFLKGANENAARMEAKAEELLAKYETLTGVYAKLKESQADYESAVDGSEDEDELAYIKKKAQSLADELSSLVDDIEKLSKEMKSTLDEFTKLSSDKKKANAQYKEYLPKYNELKASKEEDMNKIKAQLEKLEKGIGEEAVEAYKKKRKEKIYPVLYPVKTIGKSIHCGRCGTELPMAYSGSLKKGELVECDSCHRLLYQEEGK